MSSFIFFFMRELKIILQSNEDIILSDTEVGEDHVSLAIEDASNHTMVAELRRNELRTFRDLINLFLEG